MDRENFNAVISHYIDKFDYTNNEEQAEWFKWEAISCFQKNWNLEAKEFSEMYSKAVKQFSVLIDIGVIMFAVVVFVHLVTLPVELNASRRALANMESLGLVTSDSEGIARKLLTAAALTYFVALASVLVQFLRLLSLARRRN